jgi:AcrR family transcriptional regulator
MVIPPQSRTFRKGKAPRPRAGVGWTELDPEAKRARLLEVSRAVFARDGLEAPMPALAAAAGIGVGSLYRQFPSKRELLGALVVERLEEVTADVEAALASPAGPWAALTAFLWEHSQQAVDDDVTAEALAALQVDPEVKRVRAATTAALQRLIDAAVAAGEMRPDATVLDVRLVFSAARSAEQVEPGAWRRALELGIDSLAAR